MSIFLDLLTRGLDIVKRPLINFLIRPQERAHDKSVFISSEVILNESQFKGFIVLLQGAYAYKISQLISLSEYINYYYLNTANRYFDKHIQRSTTNLLQQIEAFLVFEQHHFKNYPGPDDRRLCGLTEEWGEKEWALAKQCDDLAEAMQGAYRLFRNDVLVRLKI